MAEQRLKPCPFCGGKVRISLMSNDGWSWWVVARAASEDSCRCGVFMEGRQFYARDGESAAEKKRLVEKWNRRVDDD